MQRFERKRKAGAYVLIFIQSLSIISGIALSAKASSIRCRQVSWLVTIRPSFPPVSLLAVDNVGPDFLMLLTVARQPVICTRFPFNSDLHQKPVPADSVKKELVLLALLRINVRDKSRNKDYIAELISINRFIKLNNWYF